MNRRWIMAGLATASVGLSGGASAALVDNGFGLIYDTDRNITWLADANYAKTSGYDADGLMTWSQANTFVTGLNYYGITGWRLPTSLNQDLSGPCSNWGTPATGCTGSELGHLYYTELGARAPGVPPLTPTGINGASNTAALALFKNYGTNQSFYWTSTPGVGAGLIWAFNLTNGQQVGTYNQSAGAWVWPVIDGNVAVPLPPAVLLFASALVGLGGLGFRSRKQG